MKGRVKMYNEGKGFGFILGDDTKDYFFHISDVKSVEIPQRGQYVEYTAAVGNKGPVAKDIFLKDIPTAAPISRNFVQLGNQQIKKADISQFGISSDSQYFVKVYEHTQAPAATLTGAFFRALTDKMVWNGLWEEITPREYDSIMRQFREEGFTRYRRYIKASDGEIRGTNNEVYVKKDDLKTEKRKYLYVTTVTGSGTSNFKFYEGTANFDIHKKLKEIEQLVNQ